MKEKKRGFTLVELVIVIAVIAILAGVMIAVFSNVVNKANESAKLQDEKQAEMNQKLDDIEQKLSNQSWLGRISRMNSPHSLPRPTRIPMRPSTMLLRSMQRSTVRATPDSQKIRCKRLLNALLPDN